MSEGEAGSPAIDPAEQRRVVRERYGRIATDSGGGCCDDNGTAAADLGYDDGEIASVADGANLGLGCGNPTAIADLEPGETVLDLGSGAGFDCFLAARAVGDDGHVIGVDMTPTMVEKARENVDANDATAVEFRLGEIEHLPVADAAVDVVISNCVINLSPDKPQVFREAFRVLEPGGRLAVSDVVLSAEPPEDVALDPESVAGCVAGAATVPDLEAMLDSAGFVDVSIVPKDESESFISEWDGDVDPSEFVVAARIEARKPA
jgi:SAM-dependent methyltransferase